MPKIARYKKEIFSTLKVFDVEKIRDL